MKQQEPDDIDKYISSLKMNGLSGRMIYMPPSRGKKKKIVAVYGHHASLERMEGFARALNLYGAVTVPDLPGFGGMDSFYKIDKKPTVDQLADYLAAFIKLKFTNKRITVVGISLGFVIVTRMLQKYPDLAKNVDLIVAGVGFLHHDDLIISKSKKQFFRRLTKILSTRPFALITKWLVLNRFMLKFLFLINDRKDSANETPEKRKERINFEVELWKINDVKTHFKTLNEILNINLCDTKVDVALELISVKNDQYMDYKTVNQHMKVVFSDYRQSFVDSEKHAPTIIADKNEALAFIPSVIRRRLSRP